MCSPPKTMEKSGDRVYVGCKSSCVLKSHHCSAYRSSSGKSPWVLVEKNFKVRCLSRFASTRCNGGKSHVCFKVMHLSKALKAQGPKLRTDAEVPSEAINVQKNVRYVGPIGAELCFMAGPHPEVCTVVPKPDCINLWFEREGLHAISTSVQNVILTSRHKTGPSVTKGSHLPLHSP